LVGGDIARALGVFIVLCGTIGLCTQKIPEQHSQACEATPSPRSAISAKMNTLTNQHRAPWYREKSVDCERKAHEACEPGIRREFAKLADLAERAERSELWDGHTFAGSCLDSCSSFVLIGAMLPNHEKLLEAIRL
jgi:hypothetical protein